MALGQWLVVILLLVTISHNPFGRVQVIAAVREDSAADFAPPLTWPFLIAVAPIDEAARLPESVVLGGDSGASVYVVTEGGSDGTCVGMITGHRLLPRAEDRTQSVMCVMITPLPQVLQVRNTDQSRA